MQFVIPTNGTLSKKRHIFCKSQNNARFNAHLLNAMQARLLAEQTQDAVAMKPVTWQTTVDRTLVVAITLSKIVVLKYPVTCEKIDRIPSLRKQQLKFILQEMFHRFHLTLTQDRHWGLSSGIKSNFWLAKSLSSRHVHAHRDIPCHAFRKHFHASC